jgi:hypothetical protein
VRATRPGPWRGIAAAALAGSLAWVAPSIVPQMPRLDARMLGSRAGLHALRLERQPASALCDTLNALAQPGSAPPKVLLVWEQRLALWCAVELLSESYDEAASFNAWLERGPEAALAGLRGLGLTHVIVDEASFFAMPPGGVGAEEAARLERVFSTYRGLRGGLGEVKRRGDVVLLAL